MQINYNITGQKRKSLVDAISQELNAPAKYFGAPTFAYEVGGYHIDKNGVLEGEDNFGLIADLCGLHSFQAVSEEYDTPMTYENSLGGLGALEIFEDLEMTEEEELGLGKQRSDHRGEDGMQASDVPETDESNRLVIEMPRSTFADTALENLKRLVDSKASLIKKALGVTELPLEVSDETVRFPWFTDGTDVEVVKAYTHFVTALCEMAKAQNRVNAVEKPAENEKYAFRCFLLRLGFVGDEYKTARKILLQNLSGNSAFKNGTPPKAEVTADE